MQVNFDFFITVYTQIDSTATLPMYGMKKYKNHFSKNNQIIKNN